MPISSAMTYEGSTPAMSDMSSHSPRSMTSSMIFLREFLDARPERIRTARDELLADQRAIARVIGRVHVQHHAARLLEREFIGIIEHDAAGIRGVGFCVTPDRPYILIARDGPESARVFLLMPMHRVILAQPAELLMWLALRIRGGADQIDRWGRRSRHWMSIPTAQCSRNRAGDVGLFAWRRGVRREA